MPMPITGRRLGDRKLAGVERPQTKQRIGDLRQRRVASQRIGLHTREINLERRFTADRQTDAGIAGQIEGKELAGPPVRRRTWVCGGPVRDADRILRQRHRQFIIRRRTTGEIIIPRRDQTHANRRVGRLRLDRQAVIAIGTGPGHREPEPVFIVCVCKC